METLPLVTFREGQGTMHPGHLNYYDLYFILLFILLSEISSARPHGRVHIKIHIRDTELDLPITMLLFKIQEQYGAGLEKDPYDITKSE